MFLKVGHRQLVGMAARCQAVCAGAQPSSAFGGKFSTAWSAVRGHHEHTQPDNQDQDLHSHVMNNPPTTGLCCAEVFTLLPFCKQQVAWLSKGVENFSCDLHPTDWQFASLKKTKLQRFRASADCKFYAAHLNEGGRLVPVPGGHISFSCVDAGKECPHRCLRNQRALEGAIW